jgi:hypothetical protein
MQALSELPRDTCVMRKTSEWFPGVRATRYPIEIGSMNRCILRILHEYVSGTRAL